MDINQIIIKSFLSPLSEPESKILNDWLHENEENKDSYLKLKQLHTLGKMRISSVTKNEENTALSVKEIIFRKISREKRSIYKTLTKYAAILIGFLIIGGGGYYAMKQQKENNDISEEHSQLINLASSKLETIIIRDNKIIPLNNSTSEMIIGNTTIKNNSSVKLLSLNSLKKENNKNEQKFYSIVVPKGCQYVVILPDSSEVHLNSNSELRLPDYFSDTLRSIELKGEGYFKVKRNAKATFVVNFSNNKQVRVLGTEFNINAYDVTNKITLTQGSVKVNSGNNSTTLVPSQQAIINDDNSIETHNVNVTDFTGWVDGKFSYSNAPFSEIVKDLCRRFNYDFKIVDKELNSIRLTIKLNKDTTITDMIKALNRAGETILKVRLDIESSSILISKEGVYPSNTVL